MTGTKTKHDGVQLRVAIKAAGPLKAVGLNMRRLGEMKPRSRTAAGSLKAAALKTGQVSELQRRPQITEQSWVGGPGPVP